MKRSPFSGRKRTDAEPSRPRSTEPNRPQPTEGRSRSRGALRKVALGVGVLGLAIALARRRRSGGTAVSADEVRERAEDAVPDGVRERARDAVPDTVAEIAAGGLGGEGTDERDAQAGSRSGAGAPGGTGTAGTRAGETSYVDESMSDDEVEERVEADAHEEPAPPGEMNVDPDVAEEVVGDDADTRGQEEDEESTDRR